MSSELRGATRDIAAVARAVSQSADDHALDDAFGRVRDRVERHRAARGRRATVWGLALLAAALLLVVTWRAVRVPPRPVPLAYRVTGAESSKEGYIRARHGEHPRLSFSEGSVVELADAARMRVVSVDERGGHLAIEEGEIHADIVHRAGARWSFDAGPYSVDVRGTSFAMAWRGAEGLFDLRLHSGLLDVHIPWSPTPVALHSGQRLTIRSADHQISIADLDNAAELAAAPASPIASEVRPEPSAPSAATPVPSAAVGNASAPKEHRGSWSERLASGALQSIIDEAVEHGIDVTVRERSSEDLEVLESAARYQKRPDIARRALLAQRARFTGSARAKEAAFLLGRLAEAGDGVAAHEWYERYLAEAPDGAFAAEATGRNLVVTNRVFGVERARPLAEAYLKRWPSGAHAKLARSILDGS